MSDIAYRLVVDLSTRGSLAGDLAKVGDKAGSVEKLGASAKAAAGGLEKVGDAAKSVGSSVAGLFESAVEKVAGLTVAMAKVGAGAGLAAVTYGVVGLNAELEKTTVSLASVFNAQGAADGMTDGITKAKDVIGEMRRDAAKLPGEMSDLLGFFRLGAAPGLQMGATIPQLEKLSANAMAAAASTGMDMGQASREFAQLLQGRSGAHNVFGSMLGITGDASKRFNASNGDDRLKTLEKEFGRYSESIDYFGGTFDALQSSLVDNAKQTLARSTKPLFETVKHAMGEANQWFDSHGEEIGHVADLVGTRLVTAFEWGKSKLLEWGPILYDFADRAILRIEGIWTKVGPILGALEGKAKAFMHHGGADNILDGIGGVGKVYGGLQLAKAAAPMLMPVGEAIAGSGPAGWAATAALMVALGGAVHVLTDETSAYHAKALEITDSIKEHFGGAYESIGNAFASVKPELTAVADIMGTAVLRGVQIVAVELDALAKVAEKAADLFARARDKINGEKYGGMKVNEDIDPARKPYDLEGSLIHASGLVAFAQTEAAKKTDKKSVHGHGGTNIQKVEIVVSSNQDPSRIARLTVKELADISRNPTSSRNVKNWSSMRPG